MSEMRGLANIIGNAGTIHGIAEAPKRASFESDDAYNAAYDAWWVRVNCWRSESRPA